ncbi:MAG TPA: phosphotransferase family protein, partial [Acinetobacter radioresistens]|nr:phosphotransferase family protein [Acinetobacter radioresistens]
MTVIDVGGQIKKGEELDIEAVEQWLKQQGIDLQGKVEVTQY